MSDPNVIEQPEALPVVACSDLFCFRWWYKGRTAEGNTLSLSGRVEAKDASEACDKVERAMRAKHPTVRWMQGRDIEGHGEWKGVTFGPTVQKLKTRHQNTEVRHGRPGATNETAGQPAVGLH